MTTTETTGNETITLGELAVRVDALITVVTGYAATIEDRLELLDKSAAHLDEQAHEILRKIGEAEAFITEHRAALTRGLGMLDPGAAVRKHMPGMRGKRT